MQLVLVMMRESAALGQGLRIIAASDAVREVFSLFGLAARLPAAS